MKAEVFEKFVSDQLRLVGNLIEGTKKPEEVFQFNVKFTDEFTEIDKTKFFEVFTERFKNVRPGWFVHVFQENDYDFLFLDTDKVNIYSLVEFDKVLDLLVKLVKQDEEVGLYKFEFPVDFSDDDKNRAMDTVMAFFSKNKQTSWICTESIKRENTLVFSTQEYLDEVGFTSY